MVDDHQRAVHGWLGFQIWRKNGESLERGNRGRSCFGDWEDGNRRNMMVGR
jgi:hypothetical protein